ncbi:hypothetical protein C7C46_12310 [Streptomyces tateyamensis]|uniref:Uncharacterized protein n=1 Tax=Streptomyces tateyamensis TaxID=565073 RepID=A0A2V4NLG3_9ACTN|nr:hypothetical protein C7C46_12310 [Streptomyces tateyamensis]
MLLTQRPNPNCPQCCGEGFLAYCWGDPEFGECDADPCDCWNSFPQRRVLRLPRLVARRLGWREPVYSTEPPF